MITINMTPRKNQPQQDTINGCQDSDVSKEDQDSTSSKSRSDSQHSTQQPVGASSSNPGYLEHVGECSHTTTAGSVTSAELISEFTIK